MDYKEKLLDFIKKSDINNEEKTLWELFAKMSNEDEDEAVYEAIKENNDNLLLLTKYLRDKIWDMKENDPDAWQRLVANEEKYANLLS